MKIKIIIVLFLSICFNSLSQITFFPVSPTGIPYNIIVSEVLIDNNNLTNNSQIAVFDDSLCVGVVNYSGQANTQLVAWQGDVSQQLAGFTAGAQMIFKILTVINNDSLIIDASASFIQGNGTFGFGTYSVVELNANSGVVSTQNILIQNDNCFTVFPNPFNENLSIYFDLDISESYKISIYDISGKVIQSFSNDFNMQRAEEFFWDCKNTNGQTIKNGLYLINLQTNKKNCVRKILKKL
ncbi:MAG: T9SS type A sorting domain-containing protein [Bacteroidetes bacterium]|jgi:hypothetical protein|nr:T9SS type A sorting domain-containing protein [Bacteroidota bacterium]MBT7142512.1 T9SS type A sorting domain-containing protein [Bacteroidota bacterium]MBT7490722.1 T9SS type A sorting domain-containing protein [Bacteroidota bacterium]